LHHSPPLTGSEETSSDIEQENKEKDYDDNEDEDIEGVAAPSDDGIGRHICDPQHCQTALLVCASDQRRVLELYLRGSNAGGVIEYVRLRGMAPSVADDALVRLLAAHDNLMALELFLSHMRMPIAARNGFT
jgi:hypothetical protein